MGVIFYIGDEASFEESKHPRDNAGKFAKTAGGGTGASPEGAGPLQPAKVTTRVNKLLAGAGFKKTKPQPGEPTSFVHPSGIKIVIHAQPGKSASSKFSLEKPGEEAKHGQGKQLEDVIKAVLAGQNISAPAVKSEPAPVKSTAQPVEKPTQEKSAELTASKMASSASNIAKLLEPKGYEFNGELYTDDKSFVMAKSNGSRVQYWPDTDKWLAQTPGHMTKTGNGLDNLDLLLSGKAPVFKAGQTPPWSNSSEPVGKQPAPSPEAKAAKENDSKHEKLYSKLKSQAPQPKAHQMQAISAYGDGQYSSLNNALRHDPDYTNATVQALDEYLASAEIQEDVVLYRGVKGESAKILKSIMAEGTAFIDRGYVSTSAKKGVASNFSGGLTMTIQVPKGTKGAAIGQWSGHSSEFEVLLARRTKFVVKSWDAKKGHIEAVVDQSHL